MAVFRGQSQPLVTPLDTYYRHTAELNFAGAGYALFALWKRGDLKSACLLLLSRAQAVTGLSERDLCSIHPHCSHQYHRLVSRTLSAIVGSSMCPCTDPAPFFPPRSLPLSRSVYLTPLSLRENSSQLSEGERASLTEVES